MDSYLEIFLFTLYERQDLFPLTPTKQGTSEHPATVSIVIIVKTFE